jgi:hypothetical protein
MDHTYPLAEKVKGIILLEHSRGVMMEIGAGSVSTPFFYAIARRKNLLFYSVDTKPRRFLPADANYQPVCQPGEKFLEGFDEEIFFCYLDNYDWINHWEYPNERDYQGLTKAQSEKVHLQQTIMLFPKLVPGAILLYDDTGVELSEKVSAQYIMGHASDITFYGKGARAIPYLLSQGTTVIGYSANHSHGGFKGEHDQILLQKGGL